VLGAELGLLGLVVVRTNLLGGGITGVLMCVCWYGYETSFNPNLRHVRQGPHDLGLFGIP
jgi:hypothetical protein